MDIGEAMISPARAEGQATMIHSHLMQYGGMEIMHSADLVHRPVTELVRGADDIATTNPAAGHPHRESKGIVVATVGSLSEGGPPKFTGPHEQRRFQ